MKNKKHILIINTGGTISSIKTPNGYQPQSGIVAKTLASMSSLSHPDMPTYDLIEYTPLIDSSNITLEDWNKISADIANHYYDYDGFIILHGTDTLAYSASALSFSLENLAKPVIVTGSQIPLSELRSDGRDNIITALYLAQTDFLFEVCVYFDQRLLRGNRAQKVSAYEFSAFDSPNFPPLAKVGIETNWQHSLLLPKPIKKFKRQLLKQHKIANFRLFPGFSTQVLQHLFNEPIKGLVLESYGSGNAQDNDPLFIEIIQQATNNGILILNCSQCHHGMVNMDTYATGHKLKQAGVSGGLNMTTEAAHCKMLYLLSKYKSTSTIKKKLSLSIRGETNK